MKRTNVKDFVKQFKHKKNKKKSLSLKNVQRKKVAKITARGILALGVTVGGAILVWFYTTILPNVPKLSVNELDSLFSQTTTVVDRNGKELYKLFEQHRKNVTFDQISPHMIDAIVAVEDQSFWTNAGIDVYGIMRAGIQSVQAKLFGGGLQGASTITQQSIKNLLLTNERNVTRKAKEIVLALQLDNILHEDVKNNNPEYSESQIQTAKKQRIMELYLNYIFMGNNAYGVESAANIYFNKPATELDIVESAILASIPKSPTRYNPYRTNGKLMGDLQIFNAGERVYLSGSAYNHIVQEAEKKVLQQGVHFTPSNFLTKIETTIDFVTAYEGKNYTINYKRGRKDHVLRRMLEQGYITQTELKDEFVKGLKMNFTKSSITDIKAPHFIFYIQEYITTHPEFSDLGIDQTALLEGGYTVVTTLDNDIQEKTEAIIKKYMPLARQKGGSNRAMVYLDSKNGDIIAYVGSADYNNKDIEGENDMVSIAPRQPGSTIKPFVYANLLQTTPSTIDTPMFDIPIVLGGLRPNNADGGFQGLMPLRLALGGSRNITAVKAYLAGGKEGVIKPFLKKLGLNSLINNHQYGYSLALGAGEVPMLELAEAYTHLSALGRPAAINPILQIKDPQGNIIYEKQPQKVETPTIVPEVAYLIWKILSDKSNIPPSWVSLFHVPGITMGVKSGTSNKVKANGQKVAGDGRLATYTPSKVAIFWAGNTDGSPMAYNAYGGSLNGPVMREFYAMLKRDKHISNEAMPTIPGVSSVSISKVTGKLANENTPAEWVTKTLAYRVPNKTDTVVSSIKFDTLCLGKVSEYTPKTEIKNGHLIAASTFMPQNTDLNAIINWYNEGNTLAQSGMVVVGTGKITYNYTNVFVKAINPACEQREPKINEDINVAVSYPKAGQAIGESFDITYGVNSPKTIDFVKILINDTIILETKHVQKLLSRTETINLEPNQFEGPVTIKVIAIDIDGYSNTKEIPVTLSEDIQAPYLNTNNVTLTQLASGQYRVNIEFIDDQSNISKGTIRFSENPSREHVFQNKGSTSFTVNTLESIAYVVTDEKGNKAIDVIHLQDYIQQETVNSGSTIPTPPVQPEPEIPEEDLINNLLEELETAEQNN